MKRVALIFAGLLAGVASTSLAQSATTRPVASEPPARRTMSSQQALAQRLAQFQVDGVPFSDVISMLAETSGANFSVRWNQLEQVGVDRETPISIELHNTTLAKTLDVILDSVEVGEVNLGYYVHENVITIYISRSQRTNLLTRVYDITDLTFQIPDIQPGDSRRGSGRSGDSGYSGSNSGGDNSSTGGGSNRGGRMGGN